MPGSVQFASKAIAWSGLAAAMLQVSAGESASG
jgi:hypothetical protein